MSRVLRIGVILSATIICLGLGLLAVKGIITNEMRIDAAIPYPRDLGALLSGLLALDPASVIALGLVVLIATPIARVSVSIVAFALERDWRYVAVTALVLTILIAGIILGKAVD
ncbi:MAG: DUF1634 domain-containing protein [Rectinemataceae bacterium]